MVISGITASQALTALTFTPLADKLPSVTLVHPGGDGVTVEFFDSLTGESVGSVSVGPQKPIKTSVIGSGASKTLSYTVAVANAGTLPSPGLSIYLSSSAEEDEIIGAIFDGTTLSSDGAQIVLPKPISASSTGKSAPLSAILATVPAANTRAIPTDYVDGLLVSTGTKWIGFLGTFATFAALDAVSKTNIGQGATATLLDGTEYSYSGTAWVATNLTPLPSGGYQLAGPDIRLTQKNGSLATARKIIAEFDVNGNASIPTTETVLTLQHKTGTIFALPAGALDPTAFKPQIEWKFGCGINHRYITQGCTIRVRIGNDPTLANNQVIAQWYVDPRRTGGLSNKNAQVELRGWTAVSGGTLSAVAVRTHPWYIRGEGTNSAALAAADTNSGTSTSSEVQITFDNSIDQALQITIQWDVPAGYNKVTWDGFYNRMTGKSAYRGSNLNDLGFIRANYYPFGSNLTFYGCASGRGRHVAVGQSGNIHTSLDGNNWQPVNSGTTATLRDVCWFDAQGMFIATGDSNTILTSPDGFVWTPRTAGVTLATTVKIAAGSSKAYIIGSGSGKVLSSSDGITWAEQTLPTAYTLNNVNASGTYVVVVGTSGRLAISKDSGSTWQFVTSGSTSFTACAIDSTMTKAVALGVGVCSYCLDITAGTTAWSVSATSFASAPFVSAVASGNQFVSVTSGEEIWTSPTGSAWTNQTTTQSGSGQFWGDVGQVEM